MRPWHFAIDNAHPAIRASPWTASFNEAMALRQGIEDVALADFVKRREGVGIDRDAQVIVSYFVVREVLTIVVVVDAK
jgi:hypothetical protein